MGNGTSVSPSEDDDVSTNAGPRANDRKKRQSQAQQRRSKATTLGVPDLHKGESENESGPKDPVGVDEANERIDRIPEKVLDDRNASATRANAREGDTPSANSGSDEAHNHQQPNSRQVPISKEELSKSGLDGRTEEEEGPASGKEPEPPGSHENEGSGSGTSSTGFYTSSSYSGSENSSDVYTFEDDTFFVPDEKNTDLNDLKKPERISNRDDDARIVVDGDREAPDSAELATTPNPPAASISSNGTQGKQKEVAGARSGKTKRRRPSNRHYIQDETMRTLFGLVPFYGGGDGPMDQMVKSTLASVGPNTIDVRDQEGNTLLILACQHCCEDLIEPILAKGANPAAVNGFGCCPLHYSCYAYSVSFDATEALLRKGADPSAAETTYGCTPLHYAASTGDVDLCALLLKHGAQLQVRDYYNCSAAKYAKDAGHNAIMEILEDEGEAVEEIYTIVDAEGFDEFAPSEGLWIRHMDSEMELAYIMNDETGESWWEIDLMAVAKDFLKGAPAVDDGVISNKNDPDPPPLAVREWLVQGQVCSCLVAIFSRSDPLRLMEVDLVMVMCKADFKDMLKALLVRYGVRDAGFLRNALSPKLESLGVSSLIPTAEELSLAAADEGTAVTIQANEGIPKSSEGGQSACARPPPLQRDLSSQRSLKRLDSRAIRRAEADKSFQEAILKQKKDREEQSKQQKEVLDEQRRTILSLEGKMMKRKTAVTRAKEAAEEATRAIEMLQSTLVDDSVEQESTTCLSEEIQMLKAGLAGERMQFSHITEVLETTTGSAEEWGVKQIAIEEERRVRLERLKAENDQEVEKLRTESAANLNEAIQAWKAEHKDLEMGLTKKVEQARQIFEEAVGDAAKVLSEETNTLKIATDDLKKTTARIEKVKIWIRGNDEISINSKQLDQTNKQLHSSLRREMERAKQLHNQIEDTKGQTRIYARVRPMNSLEKEAGCKEVCVKDGKEKLAFLKAAHQHRRFTHVFQTSLGETSTTDEEQAEVCRQVSGLGTSLADGYNVLLMVAGAAGSGKTMTLIGDLEEAKASGGFFPKAAPNDKVSGGGAGRTASGRHGEKTGSKRGKGKGSRGSDPGNGMSGDSGGLVSPITTPLAGLLPRLVAEAFATLNHRDAHSAFVIWVSAAHVSNMANPSDANTVESLLAPAAMDKESSLADLEDGGSGGRNRHLPPPAPPEDHIWGRAIEVSSPQEAMAIVEDARSRAASGTQTGTGRGGMGHVLSRFVVKLVNRATSEESISEMVTVELAEEGPGDTWPKALAEVVRAHAVAAGLSKQDEADGPLGMVKGCLGDTSKVLTFLCMSPADNQTERTERTLHFGEACESSGEDGASQLKELKKELARLKKESKGSKKMTPSQLPRPAGGRQS